MVIAMSATVSRSGHACGHAGAFALVAGSEPDADPTGAVPGASWCRGRGAGQPVACHIARRSGRGRHFRDDPAIALPEFLLWSAQALQSGLHRPAPPAQI
jgi:hypothetical protein